MGRDGMHGERIAALSNTFFLSSQEVSPRIKSDTPKNGHLSVTAYP